MKYIYAILLLFFVISCDNATGTINTKCKNECDTKGVICGESTDNKNVYNCNIDTNGCYQKTLLNSCQGNEVCYLGECVDETCENECVEIGTTCSSDKTQIVFCENSDSDICLDRTTQDCDDGKECIEGACVPINNGCDPNNNECGDGIKCVDNGAGENECVCESGSVYNSTSKTCDNIDECSDGSDRCNDHATCTDQPGSYDCTCNEGYVGDGFNCADINECAISNGGCSHTCENKVGGFECSCPSGYTLGQDEKTCVDVDECATDNGGCGDINHHLCENNVGATPTCSDINECLANTDNCDANATCTDTPESFTCECKSGYQGDGVSCTDIDECATNNGGCNANFYTCSNNEGALPTCVDIDECATNNGSCGDANFYSCTNNEGALPTCADIDECATNNGSCGDATYYSCTNNIGALPTCDDIDECATNNGGCGDELYYSCTNRVGNTAVCADIDECATNNGGCGSSLYYSCTNNEGAIPTCADINECLENNGGCGDATYYSCTNNIGAIRTCADIDECATDNGGCDQNCLNYDGGFTCSCNTGYTLAADNATCVDINECLNNNGGCEQTCTNLEGSFECSCIAGWNVEDNGTCTCNGHLADPEVCDGIDNNCDHNVDETPYQICGNTDDNSVCIEGECSFIGVSKIYSGKMHSCLITDGVIPELYCWGKNNKNQANPSNNNDPIITPTKVDLGADWIPIQASLSDNHTCVVVRDITNTDIDGRVVTDQDEVVCFGLNNKGQLGIDNRNENTSLTHAILDGFYDDDFLDTSNSTIKGILKVSVGAEHSCALLNNDGKVFCWGRNDKRQLGDCGTNDSNTAHQSKDACGILGGTFMQYAIDISSGTKHSCTILADNGNKTVKCWGLNDKGQLGDKSYTDRNYAVNTIKLDDSNLSGFVKIVSGSNYTCALNSSKQVYCWGDNSERIFSANNVNLYNYAIFYDTQITSLINTSMSSEYLCDIKLNNLKCMGSNSNHQISSSNDDPITLTIMSDYGVNINTASYSNNDVAIGASHTCYLTTNAVDDTRNIIRCKGRNNNCQLGNDPNGTCNNSAVFDYVKKP